MPAILSILLALSAIFTVNAASSTTVGVTYDPSSSILPPPEQVVKTLRCLRIPAVRIVNPTPAAIRAFSYSDISLLLTVPNHFIPSFAANRSDASRWIYDHVLPFHPRSHISAISVGNDAISSASSSDPSTTLIPAIRNVHNALHELGMKTISVSSAFSFTIIMAASFPPSSAEFQQPIFDIIIKPLLQFLQETNSSFMVNLYPYNIYRLRPEMPIGYATFKEDPFNFHDDIITGVRYRSLFDMMVDGVIAALAMKGHDNIPVIVAETGWPSSGGSRSSSSSTLPAETEATLAYAEMYLVGLISHLKSGLGTPLRKEGLAGVYIYELFDEDDNASTRENVTHQPGEHWGILYHNMTMKYKIDEFLASAGAHDNGRGILETGPVVLLVFAILLLL